MLAALMDSCLLLPLIFLLCSLACVFLLFSQQLLKPRRWWRGRPAGNLFWFWVFVVCRDEGNGRANTRLWVLLLSCSLRLSVYYFFLWIYALFFLCSFLRFLVFRLGLASVLPLPVFIFHSFSVSSFLFFFSLYFCSLFLLRFFFVVCGCWETDEDDDICRCGGWQKLPLHLCFLACSSLSVFVFHSSFPCLFPPPGSVFFFV